MAKEQDDSDHEEEQRAEPENEYCDRERKADYLDFKRTFDRFKGETEGMASESDNMKKQGNAYFTFGCYSQATIMYTDAIELNPHSAVLYCNRAMAYIKQDMPELALEDALMSLQMDSTVNNIKAFWRKSQALFDLNRYEDAEQAASDGLEIQGRNPQLNKVRRKAREASVTKKLVAGDWVGKSNNFEQRLAFSREGDMTMTVVGHKVPSTFELSVEGNPRSMLVRMKQQTGPGSPPPVPPMVYIFEFHNDDQELWMCHPVDGSQDLPTKFEGPGFVKAKRVESEALAELAASTEPLEKRCADYMRQMTEVMPLMPVQLPEKPDEEQIREEVELCGLISQLKTKYGHEVHQRAVELAKAPSTAESKEMQELAEQLRRRFVARRLIAEDPKAKASEAALAPTSPAPAPPAAMAPVPESAAPVAVATAPPAIVAAPAATAVERGGSTDWLTHWAGMICGGCGKAN